MISFDTDDSASNFLAWCDVAMTKCLPAKRSLWPCQRNRDMNASLSDALIMSRVLTDQISVLRRNMVTVLSAGYLCCACLHT